MIMQRGGSEVLTNQVIFVSLRVDYATERHRNINQLNNIRLVTACIMQRSSTETLTNQITFGLLRLGLCNGAAEKH
jgi:hypothetical protein